MGHIVVGAPAIARFQLHDRLLKALRLRGHRGSLLGFDPVATTFWRQQDDGVAVLPSPDAAATIDAAATVAANVDEIVGPLPARRRAAFVRAAAQTLAWLRRERPDLLLLHQDRGPAARWLQFAARSVGCRVLWTGEGLLPHTLQVDERGLDAEASCSRRSAAEFRVVRGDAELLAACLANTLARTAPVSLPMRDVVRPPLRERLRAALAVWRTDGLGKALAAVHAHRAAHQPVAETTPGAWPLPAQPFVAVLLQAARDARVQLDGRSPPTWKQLVAATRAAVHTIDPTWAVVAVAPDGRAVLPAFAGCCVVTASAAPDVIATAMAVVTVNHPLASLGLLAGTPVLHTGDAMWGIRGVATRTTVADLAAALPRALAHDYPTLRQRFLSWVFGHGHVWCSASHPNHNGMLGLVQAIEARLAAPTGGLPPLAYRRGPSWPLTAERTSP